MQLFFIIIPLATYGILTLTITRTLSFRGITYAVIKSNLIVFVFIALSTEILSFFQAISFKSVLWSWLIFLGASLLRIALLMGKSDLKKELKLELKNVDFLNLALLSIPVLILIGTLLTAVLYPPNNWDSMTYHMPRVSHWIQNNSVSFYPTSIARQNYQMPLAEFAIMHIQILTGSDLYANLVQWVNFLVLICLGYTVAVELGLRRIQCVISAVGIATLPMTILQASSTQNDLVVASFVMAFSLYMVRILKELNLGDVLLSALALGLALLTKGTAYIYCAAIGLSSAIPLLYKCNKNPAELLRVIATISLIIIIAIILNFGHLSRNYNLYRHPLSTESGKYINTEISAIGLTSNLIRNFSMHLGVPYEIINKSIYTAVESVLGVHLNNPKTTFLNTEFDIKYRRHEDRAGNFFHMVLALLGLFLLPILWRRRIDLNIIWYTSGLLSGVILYCTLVQWQPWATRLHTPIFALFTPLMAIFVTTGSYVLWKSTNLLLISLLIFYGLFVTIDNETRSLISLDWYKKERIELYFANRNYLFDSYETIIRMLREAGTNEVALYIHEDAWEYPFWVFSMHQHTNRKNISFHHVGVDNESSTIGKAIELSEYIISNKKFENWIYSNDYKQIYSSDCLTLHRRVGTLSVSKPI